MIKGFWEQVQYRAAQHNRPIICLAPMADVTDQVFRAMIAKYSRMGQPNGGPDVMWTEFVSCDGLCSPGREVLQHDLVYGEGERPIVAQLFTANPDNMRRAVAMCRELGFDGVDINMGCPVGTIVDQGAGSAMILNPDLAVEVIKAAQEAAGDIPISVKTRIGYNKIEYKEWLPHILSCNIPALTIHLRTKKEMSAVDAHWELYKEIKEFCKNISPETIIIGNGDVADLLDAQNKHQDENIQAEGIMIGRGVFGKPWAFDWNTTNPLSPTDSSPRGALNTKLKIMLEHTKLYEEKLGHIKSFSIMKKHFKAYVNGFDGAKELRVKLMEANNYKEIESIVNEFLLTNKT